MDEISDRELWIRRAIFAIVVLFLFWLIVIRGCEPPEEEKVLDLYKKKYSAISTIKTVISVIREFPPTSSEDRKFWAEFFREKAEFVREQDAELAKYPQELRSKVWKKCGDGILMSGGVFPESYW